MNEVKVIEAVPILGSIVTWDSFQAAPRGAMLGALGAEGLASGPLPLALSLNDRVRRALELAFPLRSRDPGQWEVKAIPQQRGVPARFCVIRHKVSDVGTLAVDDSGEVWANGSQMVVSETDPGKPIERAVSEKLGFVETHFLARDVRSLVTDVVLRLAKGFPLRSAGGVYLVMLPELELVSKLDRALIASGAGQLTRFDIVDDEKARATARDAAEENLRALVAETRASVAALKDGARKLPGSIAARSQEVTELRDRAEFLRGVLGIQVEEIDATLDECQSMMGDVRAAAEGGAR